MMQKIKAKPNECLLCGSKDRKTILSYKEPDQYEVAVGLTGENYLREWVECTGCGFYYSVYSREGDILEKIYTSAYRSENSPWRKGSAEDTFNKITAFSYEESEMKQRTKWAKDGINNAWRDGVLVRPAAPHKLLDIGGGTGIFAYEFQDNDWKSYIVDPNEDSKFISKFGISLIQEYYKPGLFSEKFDLISMTYVLEHLNDPVSILKNLHSDMTGKSFLYIEVPDSVAFLRKPPEDDIFNSCHLWMFGPNSLVWLFEQCGFELVALIRKKVVRGHYALMALAAEK